MTHKYRNTEVSESVETILQIYDYLFFPVLTGAPLEPAGPTAPTEPDGP